ncbi:GNAT family N-acetyltransferase [Jeotgalibaca sp. MA1X17-3]|uniref:GNAT family N-acetyltransferase n=1 Tax=Jeotgalibaca sp. MA1X17-3 TaxID=2908211 RepID=UPI001F3394E8|nr:GNAT family N-acetyltransferase [Jeotgalibaca sp. MA1X17-3]UJF15395.1 GNAT family N-acetyltransferase [Jeotgalibaca sp. MA1X17-3]
MQHVIKKMDRNVIRTDQNKLNYNDVYFTHKYAQLYEEVEKGETQTIYFENELGKVEYTFLKREVPYKIDGKQYYDITTAYGYGGPCIQDCTDPEGLLKEFNAAFTKYCLEQDIISEFIRFHLFENEEVRTNFDGQVKLMGPHVARNLKQTMTKNMDKDILSSVRKAKRNEITFTIDTSGKHLDEFLFIYYETMKRNEATSFYYFDRAFFEKLHHHLEGEIVYIHGYMNDEIVGSLSVIYSDTYGYGFLGGVLKEYLRYGTSAFLQYQLMEWLKEKGVEYFIIGGGYRDKDSLYNYKRKFDLQGSYPFYTGNKVHNQKIYQLQNQLRKEEGEFDPETTFFPLYRS